MIDNKVSEELFVNGFIFFLIVNLTLFNIVSQVKIHIGIN